MLVRALHTIRSYVARELYDSNLGSPGSLSMQDTVIRRLQLIWELEEWKHNCPSAFTIASYTEIDNWSTASYNTNRFRVLLSMHYYSTALLINGPVLTNVLLERNSAHQNLHPCTSEAAIAIEHDFSAATEFSKIVDHIAKTCPEFIDQNALWWTSNYNSNYLPLFLGYVAVLTRNSVYRRSTSLWNPSGLFSGRFDARSESHRSFRSPGCLDIRLTNP